MKTTKNVLPIKQQVASKRAEIRKIIHAIASDKASFGRIREGSKKLSCAIKELDKLEVRSSL